MPDPIIIEFEEDGLDEMMGKFGNRFKSMTDEIRAAGEQGGALFDNLISSQVSEEVLEVQNAIAETKKTMESATPSADALSDRFASMRERIDGLKNGLSGEGGGGGANAGLLDFVKGAVASGAAALIASKAIGAVKDVVRETVELVNDYADAVEKSPELFTDEEVENVARYGRELKKIEDLKLDLGEQALPTVSKLTAFVADYARTVSELGTVFDLMERGANAKAIRNLGDTLDAVNSSDKAMLTFAKDAARVVKIREDLGEELKGISLLGVTESLQGQADSFNDTQDSLLEKQDEVVEAIIKAEKDGYSPWSETINDLKKDFQELSNAMSENVKENEENTQKLILDKAKLLLSADGLSTDEERFLVEQGIALGVYTESVAAKTLQVINDAELIAAAYTSETDIVVSQLGSVEGALDTIDNRRVNVYIDAHWSGLELLGIGGPSGPGSFNASENAVRPSGVIVEQANTRTTDRGGIDIPFITQEVIRGIGGR